MNENLILKDTWFCKKRLDGYWTSMHYTVDGIKCLCGQKIDNYLELSLVKRNNRGDCNKCVKKRMGLYIGVRKPFE